MIEQRDDIIGHQVISERLRVARAAAMAAAVDEDDAMPARDLGHLQTEIIGVGKPAMEKDHRASFAEFDVIEADAVHLRSRAAPRNRRRSRRQAFPPLGSGGAVKRRQAGESSDDKVTSIQIHDRCGS